MKHVPKQEWLGCAVAAAAMLTDRRYEDVLAHWPGLNAARVRQDPAAFCALLQSLARRQWHFTAGDNPLQPVHKFSAPPWPVAVYIQEAKPCPRYGQWIVLAEDLVHDPGAPTAYPAGSYPLRDWVVTTVAQPAHLAALPQGRAWLRNALQPAVTTLIEVKTSGAVKCGASGNLNAATAAANRIRARQLAGYRRLMQALEIERNRRRARELADYYRGAVEQSCSLDLTLAGPDRSRSVATGKRELTVHERLATLEALFRPHRRHTTRVIDV